MKIICSWCDIHIGHKPGPDVITHGMCDECSAKMHKQVKEYMNREKDDESSEESEDGDV